MTTEIDIDEYEQWRMQWGDALASIAVWFRAQFPDRNVRDGTYGVPGGADGEFTRVEVRNNTAVRIGDRTPPPKKRAGREKLEYKAAPVKVNVRGGYDVIFIPLDEYLPPYREGYIAWDLGMVSGIRFRAELHEDLSKEDDWQFASLPLAVAWIYVFRFKEEDGTQREGVAEVRYLEVPRPLRRRGYATLLWEGLELRWRVCETPAFTEAGAAFLEAIGLSPDGCTYWTSKAAVRAVKAEKAMKVSLGQREDELEEGEA
jgi:hypothetical protein